MSRIGAIFARVTEISYPLFRIDFTRHNNAYDSDDEENERQWSFAIRFTYDGKHFLNEEEIPYDHRERYTCMVFWKNESCSLAKMIDQTFRIRGAKKESVPTWNRRAIHYAAENAWDRVKSTF